MQQFDELARERWAARGHPSIGLPGAGWIDNPGEVSAAELREVYAPLAEMVATRGDAARASGAPFVVSIVGSVAVGKSTAARALSVLLGLTSGTAAVDVVALDGFLFPNRELAARGLMERKGFPETFDRDRLADFLAAVKGGAPEVRAPLYSHERYDVLGDEQLVCRPDVLILEGLPVVTDPVDLGLYLDADEVDIEEWYVARFLTLRREALGDDTSFFRYFADLTETQTTDLARQVWDSINRVNLHEHVLPAREHADVVFEKGADHAVRRVRLRRP